MKKSLFSGKERRILGYVIFVTIIIRVLLAFRSEEAICTRPFIDDTFYVFNCAEHFAHGDGFSADGIHLTNGVQPLIVTLYAPLFFIAGSDKLLALKFSFILIALFDSLSVLLVARIVRLLEKKNYDEDQGWLSPPIVASILWALLYPIMIHTANGLETGVYSCLLLAVFSYYITICRSRESNKHITFLQLILLGTLSGVTVLARIDAVFLVIAFATYEIVIFKGKGVVYATIISVTAFIISLPWWWYNFHIFGSLMPQSGISESFGNVLGENIAISALTLSDLLSFFFILPHFAFPMWFDLGCFAVMLTIIGIVVKKYRLRTYLKASYDFRLIKPWLLFFSILFIYYIFFFSAPFFFPRYFHPLRILYLIAFSCSAPEIFRISRDLFRKGKKVTHYSLYAIIFCAFLFSGANYSLLFYRNDFSDLFHTGKWALLHPTEQIGMPQSGVAGYIASNVINLDGKVNFAALQASRHEGIGGYIESQKLDYLADWRGIIEPLVVAATNSGCKFEKIDSIGRVVIYKRIK